MKRIILLILPLLTLVSLAGPAPAFQENQAPDDARDAALHELHVQEVEQQVEAAEAFAAELMNRAAAENLDLTQYVKDAQYLANVDPPATPEEAAKLEEAHRDTLNSVENLLGLPGLFGTLHGRGPQPFAFIPLGVDVTSGGSCTCENLVFDAPHPGSNRANYPLGAISVSPAPVWELGAEFSSGVIAAGHQVASTGETFSAPAGVRSVSASATMDLSADVGVGGLGVAHGWSDVEFVVKDTATGVEMCRSPRLETANLAAGVGHRRSTPDLGERTLGCSFVRATPGAAATYKASIMLRAYGTYAGFVGGHSRVRAKFKRIDVMLCP